MTWTAGIVVKRSQLTLHAVNKEGTLLRRQRYARRFPSDDRLVVLVPLRLSRAGGRKKYKIMYVS